MQISKLYVFSISVFQARYNEAFADVVGDALAPLPRI